VSASDCFANAALQFLLAMAPSVSWAATLDDSDELDVANGNGAEGARGVTAASELSWTEFKTQLLAALTALEAPGGIDSGAAKKAAAALQTLTPDREDHKPGEDKQDCWLLLTTLLTLLPSHSRVPLVAPALDFPPCVLRAGARPPPST
jgi:hypothetical protein